MPRQAIRRAGPPPPVRLGATLIFANIALSALALILTFVYLDQIVELITAGMQLDDVGLNNARVGASMGAFGGFLLFGALYAVLAVFIRKGANWARVTWTVLAVVGVVFGLIGLLGGQPVALLLLSLVSAVITIWALFLLWKKESSAYFAR